MSKFIRYFTCLLFLSSFSSAIYAEEPDLLGKLDAHNFVELGSVLNGLQKNFEAGYSSETALRNTYRPFYKLSEKQELALRQWVKVAPTSYPAHLALGIFLKKAGQDARGQRYISETPKENIDEMERLFALSRAEFGISLGLTNKPYLTVFHLLDISIAEGDEKTTEMLLAQANRIFPGNRLARTRYLVSLEPRWGGSYLKMKQFIADTKKQGVDQGGILQLEAILYQDLGQTAWEAGDDKGATINFLAALDRAKKIGGSFRQDWLYESMIHVCSGTSEYQEYCQEIK
ncbi:hypothetical protein [Andreprevotia chitinilytica]|uniref:hypothetical protein n=1 Tax=Andreprevotia chitinilytica TaxID=396808 RepID=UPI00054E883F|nr:hypothetical protein [Andreprevotia chitinilytica]